MATQRRIGSEDSQTRQRLLNAAEELLRTQGHSAVTVRKVAAHSGLKRQLVHYYFRSMEDLYLEVLDRAYERHFARLAPALEAANPVRSLWDVAFLAEAILLEIYTLPLANQSPAIRASIAAFLAKSRSLQVSALRRLLDRDKRPLAPSAEAAAVFIRAVAREIAMERNLGFIDTHNEALATIEAYLQYFDDLARTEG